MMTRIPSAFTGFLVFAASAFAIDYGNRCSNKTEVELYDPENHAEYDCWPVPDCQEGQECSVEPGSSHPTGTVIECNHCPSGSFSNVQTNKRCHTCTTCGNKKVILNCTIVRDTQCSNRTCISNKFFFNDTDQRCYPCTECCGINNETLEPQCILSTLQFGAVIGGKGAFHCSRASSEPCDELPKNNVPTESNNHGVVGMRSGWSFDALHIGLICGLVSLAFLCLVLLWFFKREREMRLSGNDYLSSSRPCFWRWFSSSLPSAGHGCVRTACSFEMTPCITPFQEKLKFIPEDVKINTIPYEVEELIKRLDEKRPQCKNWRDVGRKLGMSVSDLNLIKREDDREGGSPTTSLLSNLCTWENIISLRKFVQTLHDLKRHDIVNAVIEFYKPNNGTNA